MALRSGSRPDGNQHRGGTFQDGEAFLRDRTAQSAVRRGIAPSQRARRCSIGTRSTPTSPCSARRSTSARSIAPARASGRAASARPRPCTRSATTAPTITRTTSCTCRATVCAWSTSATPTSSIPTPRQSHANIEFAVRKILAAGALPVVLGGDHSVNDPVHPRLRRPAADPHRADRRAPGLRRRAPRRAPRPWQSDEARRRKVPC